MIKAGHPCLYYKETENGLVLWLSWIDDCLCVGPDVDVKKARVNILARFECDDVGELKEYLGCKIDRHMDDVGWIKLTQPVLLQSFEDEFEMEETGREAFTPAVAESEEVISEESTRSTELELVNYCTLPDGADRISGMRHTSSYER